MEISIIVATRNRSYAITKCLDSVAKALAHAPPIGAEIIVVDNASTDDTSAAVEQWAASHTLQVRPMFEAKNGTSAARNRGIREAKGKVLVFIDDDCRMSCTYIVDLLRHAMADTEPVLRGGRVDLGDKTDLPITIKTDSHVMRWQRRFGSIKQGHIGTIVLGANITMQRGVIEKVGYFDENLGPGTKVIQSAEDTDYFSRVYLADIPIEYVPDMGVFHFHGRKSRKAAQTLLQDYMIGAGALYVRYLLKNPDFCRPLWWDIRHSLKEIVSGTNTFLPEIGFSHRDKVMWCLRGGVRYLFNVEARRN